MSLASLRLALPDGSSWPIAHELPFWPARLTTLWQELVESVRFSAQTEEECAIASTDDQRDIAASLRGDGEAYARLVDRYQQKVAAWMWRFTRDRGQWEILVQDVLVETYTALAGYRGQGSFEGWLRTIATRVGYRFWKQRARRRQQEPISLQDWDQVAREHPESLAPDEAAQQVHDLLAGLSPRDRVVLTLHYLEAHSVREIAQQLGWTQSMVKVQLHRARKKLRQRLETHDR